MHTACLSHATGQPDRMGASAPSLNPFTHSLYRKMSCKGEEEPQAHKSPIPSSLISWCPLPPSPSFPLSTCPQSLHPWGPYTCHSLPTVPFWDLSFCAVFTWSAPQLSHLPSSQGLFVLQNSDSAAVPLGDLWLPRLAESPLLCTSLMPNPSHSQLWSPWSVNPLTYSPPSLIVCEPVEGNTISVWLSIPSMRHIPGTNKGMRS